MILSKYNDRYEIDYVEAIFALFFKLYCEVEPLGVSSRINVVLKH